MLASLGSRNERRVEGIIRSRTWGLVAERCGNRGWIGRGRWISGGQGGSGLDMVMMMDVYIV